MKRINQGERLSLARSLLALIAAVVHAKLMLLVVAVLAKSSDFSVEQIRQHCNGSLTIEQYDELLELSDISTFVSYLEAPFRTRRVAEIFADAGDRRGIFSSMYVTITDESTRSTREGEYENQHLAEELVFGFAKRYLGPLHDHLTGVDRNAQEAKWVIYYELTAQCRNSPLYVLGTGVNTHLTYDLPWTLIEINATDSFEVDFTYFGELLVEKTLESSVLTNAQQGFDPYPFFNGFFVGQLIDTIFGYQTTARFIFQFVRSRAFTDFQRLRDNPKGSWWYGSADRRWWFRQGILQYLP